MTSLVQQLRERTGIGVMACKMALDAAGGDIVKAEQMLASQGIAAADKKSERITGFGRIEAYVHADRIGALVDLRCETDFVARTDDFKNLAHELAMQIVAMNPGDVAALLDEPNIRDGKCTVGNMIKQAIAKFGENIKVERFCRFEVGSS